MRKVPTVFLDRDGVINRPIIRNGKPYPPASVSELEILPGAIHSLNLLVSMGYYLIVVTNQPDVARGNQTREVVDAINALILDELPIKEIFTCYHDSKDDCPCRKPKPGLILQGAEKYNSDLTKSWMVGDRWKDITAGKAAGLRTVLVDYNYAEIYNGLSADFIIKDMASLADIILKS